MKLLRKKNGQWLTVSLAVGGLLLRANSLQVSAQEPAGDLEEDQLTSGLDFLADPVGVSDTESAEPVDLKGLEEAGEGQTGYSEGTWQEFEYSQDHDEPGSALPESFSEDLTPSRPNEGLTAENKEDQSIPPAQEDQTSGQEAQVQESVNEEADHKDREAEVRGENQYSASYEDQKSTDLNQADWQEADASNLARPGTTVKVPVELETENPADQARDQSVSYRSDQVNLQQTWSDGYRGQGQVVAIIDSGLYVDHDAFAPLSDLDQALYQTEEELNQAKAAAGIDYGRWFNNKVIFGHNYNDVNDNLSEVAQASHGTHVSDSAVGNTPQALDIGTEVNPASRYNVHGVAPEAQLMFMRVFSDVNGAGTSEYLYVQAIEDAVALGASSINLSLGAVAGSQYESSGALERAIAQARRQGVSVVIAAGNENSFGDGHSKPRAQHPDYGVVGTPSTSRDSISVAAFESDWLVNDVMNLVDQDGQVTSLPYTIVANGGEATLETPAYAGQAFAYEHVGLGTPSELLGVDLTGKFALISRGQITFTEKAQFARQAGAAGVVIYNNVNDGTTVNMGIEDLEGYPIIGVTYDVGQVLIDNQESHLLSFTGEKLRFKNPNAGQPSNFTSWGLTADGELKPDLAAPGGNIYGAVNNNEYQSMSGTSMASPHVAGAVALLNQRLPDLYPGLEGEELSSLVKALLMSSARPHYNTERGAFTSPRQQGAGLIDVDNALSSGVYLTGLDNYPSISLRNVGDRFEFDIKVYNISNEDKLLNITSHLTTDAVEDSILGKVFALEPRHLKDIPEGQVLVPAHSHEIVTISIDAREFAQTLSRDMPNGYFLEGYVSFGTSQDPLLASIPFVGFRGDFANLDVVEKPVYDFDFDMTTDYSDTPFYFVDLSNSTTTPNFTTLITNQGNYLLNLGLDTIASLDSDEEVTLAISPDNDGSKDFLGFKGVFLRNYEDFRASVYALNDLGEAELVWVSQPAWGIKNYFGGTPFSPKSSFVLSSIWEGQDFWGRPVADGLYRYDITVRSQVPGSLTQLLSFNVHVSRTKPRASGADFDEDTRLLTLREVENVYPGLNPYRTRIMIGNPPDSRLLSLGLIQDTRLAIYLNGHGNHSFTIPDQVDLFAVNAYLHLEDYAGNISVTLLSDILHGQGGVVEFKLRDARTGQDLTGMGLRVRIRDEEGNIVEGHRLQGLNNQNVRRLPYGAYTAEVFLMNEEYLDLVNEPVQTFFVTEDNSWQEVEFLVNLVEQVDVRIELNQPLPAGGAIYLVDGLGQATLVPQTSYVNTVHQVRVRAGDYVLRVQLPEGYVSDQNGQQVIVDSTQNVLVVEVRREEVDKSDLGQLIDYARGVDQSQLEFVDQFLLNIVLEDAVAVYENPDALQRDVDYQTAGLRATLERLNLLDTLAEDRAVAKERVSELTLLSEAEVLAYNDQIDLADSREAIARVVSEAKDLQAERQAQLEAVETLARVKDQASSQINDLEALDENRKNQYLEAIASAESVEAVTTLVSAALEENEQAKAEAERQAQLNQAKQVALDELRQLENLPEDQSREFARRIEAADNLENVQAILAEARQADELAQERLENERLEQLLAQQALATSKDLARRVVDQLSELSDQETSRFLYQVEAATTPEEVNAVIESALKANNDALLANQEAEKAALQAQLEAQAEAARQREADLQAQLEAQAEAARQREADLQAKLDQAIQALKDLLSRTHEDEPSPSEGTPKPSDPQGQNPDQVDPGKIGDDDKEREDDESIPDDSSPEESYSREGETSVDSVYDFIAPVFEWVLRNNEVKPDPEEEDDKEGQEGSGTTDTDQVTPDPTNSDVDTTSPGESGSQDQDSNSGTDEGANPTVEVPSPEAPDVEEPSEGSLDPDDQEGAEDPSLETPKVDSPEVKKDLGEVDLPTRPDEARDLSQANSLDKKVPGSDQEGRQTVFTNSWQGKKDPSQNKTNLSQESQKPTQDKQTKALPNQDKQALPKTATGTWILGLFGLTNLVGGLFAGKKKKG